MKAYRWTVNVKLGLVAFAFLIALASLAYTTRLVNQLRERERTVVQMWGKALERLGQIQDESINPHQATFLEMESWLRQASSASLGVTAEQAQRYRQAIGWAQGMPPSGEVTFILDVTMTIPEEFRIPAIITDPSAEQPFNQWRNVPIDATSLRDLTGADSLTALRTLTKLRQEMDEAYEPIAFQLGQQIHFGESDLVKELRIFPYLQLLFVGLFIMTGYFTFSYVRRSEQRSLWVGMAKEAAHQLGTPISSLMGWTELLRLPDLPDAQRTEAVGEMSKDIERLKRVTNRFSDIGSLPKLEVEDVGRVVEMTADYIRRRIPQQGKQVSLTVDIAPRLKAPLNAELFEWVIENLLKNALDAIETKEGRMHIKGFRMDGKIVLQVSDTGKGIDRRNVKNVFRPGYSTKKRGWGLGLSLAKRIIDDYHGGTLFVEQSKVGQGTTFRIEVPEASSTAS